MSPHDLPAPSHLTLIGADQLAKVAAQDLASADLVQPDRRFVGVQHGAVESRHQQRIGRLFEQRPVPLLRRDQAFAQAEVGQGDAGYPGNGVEGSLVKRQHLHPRLEEAEEGTGQLLTGSDRDCAERLEAGRSSQRQDPVVDLAHGEVAQNAASTCQEQGSAGGVLGRHSLEP